MHWFWDPSGHWVIFWSGFGSCLTEFGIIGVVWHHVNCHTKGCWRLARHPVEHTPYKVCAHHHPSVPNRGATMEEIAHHHKLGMERAAAAAAAANHAPVAPSATSEALSGPAKAS